MKKIAVEKNNSGKRIDKFLKEEVFFNDKISRGEVIRQIRDGNILVNGKKIKPSYVLKENDVVTMNKEQRTKNNIVPNKNIALKIICKDENIIAVNKPAGVQVHPDAHEKENTLVNFLIAKFPEIKKVGEDPLRPGIVHRLDKDTSGAIIIARNQNTFEELKKKFKNREVEKRYWAIIYGKPEREGVIDKPLARAATYRKQVIAGKKTKTKIREAVTEYKIIKSSDAWSLLEVRPKTGRMHQIRVHLTSIGCPIVGDKVYKTKNTKLLEAPRQMLHAKGIEFELFGKKYDLEADLPDDFNQFLTKG